MTSIAQFVFVDGGERAPGNNSYYEAFGINTGNIGSGIPNSSLVFFHSANHDSTQYWAPPGVSYTTFFFGVRTYISNPSYQFRFYNANGNAQFYVYTNGNYLQIYNGNGTTLLGQASILIPTPSIIYLEISATISATVGSVAVRLNGNPTPIISLTGVNTVYDTTSLPVTYFYIAEQTNDYDSYIRDMYFHDGTGPAPFNNFLGDVGCQIQYPNADITAQFTPIGNSLNYQNVNQVPPNSSFYNESSTVGQIDTFSVTSLKTNTLSVIAIKLFDYSYKTDSGTRALAKILTSGSSTGTGAINYLGTSGVVTEDTYTVNVNGGATWTPSTVNSLTIGYEVIV